MHSVSPCKGPKQGAALQLDGLQFALGQLRRNLSLILDTQIAQLLSTIGTLKPDETGPRRHVAASDVRSPTGNVTESNKYHWKSALSETALV